MSPSRSCRQSSRRIASVWLDSSEKPGCSPGSITHRLARSTASRRRTRSADWCSSWWRGRRQLIAIRTRLVVVLISLCAPWAAYDQRSQEQAPSASKTAIDDTIEAGEAEAVEPRRKLVTWNEYEGPFFTIRMGG